MKVLAFCLLLFLGGVSAYVYMDGQTTTVDDLWLEEVTAEKALNWVKDENIRTTSILEQNPQFVKIQEEAEAILTSDDKLLRGGQFDGYFYNLYRGKTAVKGIWRRQAWEDYKNQADKWENLLDLDQLAKKEQKSWVYKGSDCRKENQRCLLVLSDGGGDASHVREFDLTTKTFVEDGFITPESKSGVEWYDNDTVLLANTFGENSVTDSGYSLTIKVWKRGTSYTEAKEIFRGKKEDVSTYSFSVKDGEKVHYFVGRSPSFFTSAYYYLKGEEAVPLNLPEDVSFRAIMNNQLVLSPTHRSLWNEGWGLGCYGFGQGPRR